MKRLAALLLLAALPALAEAIPQRITAEYELVNNGLTVGRVQESFVRTGDKYTIQSVSRSEGVLKALYDEQITLHSSGKVVEGGLQPMQFDERRTRDSRRDVSATFDWEQGVMRSRYRGEVTRHALAPATQDRISMMYQFMFVKPKQGNMTLAMSNGRKVDRYTYRLVNEVRVATPSGDYETLHFERVTSEPNDRQVEVWLAKSHHFFPVRVLFDDPRGFRVEQRLLSLRTE
jgi:hypothetical protein